MFQASLHVLTSVGMRCQASQELVANSKAAYEEDLEQIVHLSRTKFANVGNVVIVVPVSCIVSTLNAMLGTTSMMMALANGVVKFGWTMLAGYLNGQVFVELFVCGVLYVSVCGCPNWL